MVKSKKAHVTGELFAGELAVSPAKKKRTKKPKVAKKDIAEISLSQLYVKDELPEYIVGIDASVTGFAMVVIDRQEKVVDYILEGYSVERGDLIGHVQRSLKLAGAAMTFLNKYPGVLNVAIENYAFRMADLSVVELVGFLKGNYFLKNKLPFVSYSISSIKKFFTSKGNADKNKMLESIVGKWEIPFKDNNLVDAFAVAVYHKQTLEKVLKSRT